MTGAKLPQVCDCVSMFAHTGGSYSKIINGCDFTCMHECVCICVCSGLMQPCVTVKSAVSAGTSRDIQQLNVCAFLNSYLCDYGFKKSVQRSF